jgi:uncharacterized protein (TIGR03067 family)
VEPPDPTAEAQHATSRCGLCRSRTGGRGQADPPTDDLDRAKRQGAWLIVASAAGGEKVTRETGGKVVVSGDRCTLAVGDRKEAFGYRMGSGKSPKWLDLIADKWAVVPCVYDLDGDTLRIRYPKGGIERATEFEPKREASNVRLLSLNHVR